MQRQPFLSNSEDAVSPIIGTVLILAIMVSITGTMLAWGIPQIQESEAYAIFTSSQNNGGHTVLDPGGDGQLGRLGHAESTATSRVRRDWISR